MKWTSMNLNDFHNGLFPTIDKQWFLLTAEHEGITNTMTISWGAFGILYNQPIVMVAVREERYTKEFIDQSPTFSLTSFDENYHKELAYLGKVSGRDEDKIQKSGLTLSHYKELPIFEEANMSILCEKFAATPMPVENYINHPEIEEQFYNKNGHHTFYFAFIKEILTKES